MSIVNVPPVSGRAAADLDGQWLESLVWEFLYLDAELAHYRVKNPGTGEAWRIVRPAPLASASALHRLEHEYSLRELLFPGWSLQPLALLQSRDGLLLVLNDPALRCISNPMAATRLRTFSHWLRVLLPRSLRPMTHICCTEI